MNKLKELWLNKKSTFLLYGGIIIGVLILIIILIIILSVIFRKYEPKEIEKMMVTSTQKYLKENISAYPTNNNPVSTVEVSSLVEKELMKDLSKISKENNCNGHVNIILEKTEDKPIYRYVPYLECDDYTTPTLLETIHSREDIVDDREGLHQMGDTYYYKGEFINNYLDYVGYSWRIFKFDKNRIYLVLADTLNDTSYVFDDRYNETTKSNRGKNSFDSSRIIDVLEGFYNNFFKDHHAYLKTMNACVHSRSVYDTLNDGSIECYTTFSTPISLLSVYDYMNASNDSRCFTSLDRNCSNYNYLSKTKNNWWLLNGTNENSYHVYVSATAMSGSLRLDSANQKNYLRVVIALPSDIIYKDGIGTKDKPYTFYEY